MPNTIIFFFYGYLVNLDIQSIYIFKCHVYRAKEVFYLDSNNQ